MASQGQNFEMWAGDDLDVVAIVKDASGTVVDITGATVEWALRLTVDSPVLLAKDTAAGITLTNPTQGEFTITLAPADTSALGGRSYYHEAEVTLGGKITTVLTGWATIHRSAAP